MGEKLHAERRSFFETLETRRMFSVVLGANVNGLAFSDTPSVPPPNTQIAVGPNQILEVVNNGIAVYNKSGTLLGKATLSDALASISPGPLLLNPQVSYDELAGRFIIGVLDIDPANQNSQLDLLVSRSSDLTQGFAEVHKIDLDETIPGAEPQLDVTYFASSPRLGWNYDSYVFSFEMSAYPNGAASVNAPGHSQILSIDKSSVLDNNSATLNIFHLSNHSGSPVIMHGAKHGNPMLFVQTNASGYNNGSNEHPVPVYNNVVGTCYVGVNLLSNSPTFEGFGLPTIFSTLGSDPATPPAPQPGGILLNTGDTRVASAAYRNNHLVYALTGGGEQSEVPQVLAVDIDLSKINSNQQSYQVYRLDSPNAVTFSPAIDIAPNGDIGLTYLETGPNEYLSTYFTGRKPTDAPGTLQPPRLIKAGEAIYQSLFELSPHLVNGNISLDPSTGYLAGQYGGIAVDPVNGSFWGANEYATSRYSPIQTIANWGTWIGNLALTPAPSTAVASSLPVSHSVLSRQPVRTGSKNDLHDLLV